MIRRDVEKALLYLERNSKTGIKANGLIDETDKKIEVIKKALEKSYRKSNGKIYRVVDLDGNEIFRGCDRDINIYFGFETRRSINQYWRLQKVIANKYRIEKA